MPVAALYDIHGNLPALRAVLADVAREDVDRLVIGGDVAAGPMPCETLDHLTTLSGRAQFVLGNADREIVDAYDRGRTDVDAEEAPAERAAAFAAPQISSRHRGFLAGFAPGLRLEIDGLASTLL